MIGPAVSYHISESWQENTMQYGKLRARCPRFIYWLFQFDHKYSYTIVIADSVSSTLRPERTRSQGTSDEAFGDHLRATKKQKNEDIHPTRGDLVCDLLDWHRTLWMNVFRDPVTHPQAFFRESDREPPKKVVSGEHSSFTQFQSTKNAKFAGEPTLRGDFSRSALVKLYFKQKSFGFLTKADDKSSVSVVNFDKITDSHGYRSIRAKKKKPHRRRKEV